ncbi:hypothetical protein KIN20_038441 [Parelaphostrongylus tenuis]|uniref:Uncharacterized protein n=1 Tax=Parelaphostrongylus tenuis TaxID=148309 RepID=A0AAD5R0F1_PARTN|nr:hypothetical protein KIN20_038441 [Parelaphostrongylus tenuis]
MLRAWVHGLDWLSLPDIRWNQPLRVCIGKKTSLLHYYCSALLLYTRDAIINNLGAANQERTRGSPNYANVVRQSALGAPLLHITQHSTGKQLRGRKRKTRILGF